jgi:hypothetical protein
MGVIQSAINQLLGSSTIIAAGAKHFQQQKLAAEAQASEAAEKGTVLVSERNLRRDIESGASPEDIQQKEKRLGTVKDIKTAGDIQRSLKLAKAEKGGLIEGRKQLKSLTEIKEKSRDIYKKTVQQYMTDEATRQENALLKVAEKSESQQKQKRNFKKYPEDLKKTINILKGRDITDDNK